MAISASRIPVPHFRTAFAMRHEVRLKTLYNPLGFKDENKLPLWVDTGLILSMSQRGVSAACLMVGTREKDRGQGVRAGRGGSRA